MKYLNHRDTEVAQRFTEKNSVLLCESSVSALKKS